MREPTAEPRLLVTGFGPFPGVEQNPTAELIEWLEGRLREPGGMRAKVATAVFPTDWRTLPESHARLIADHRPDIAIHFGLQASAKALHVEQRAQNWRSGEPDVAGPGVPASPVLGGKPRLLHTPYPVESLVDHLHGAGLPARVSVCAGAYLCNMAYFLSLQSVGGAGCPRAALFIHVPPIAASSGDGKAVGISRLQLRRCALAVIDHAAREISTMARDVA